MLLPLEIEVLEAADLGKLGLGDAQVGGLLVAGEHLRLGDLARALSERQKLTGAEVEAIVAAHPGRRIDLLRDELFLS